MLHRRLWLAGFLLLGGGVLHAQVPPEERIPITDPDRLEALGLARDATNVYVWSKAPGGTRTRRAQDANAVDVLGASVGYSTLMNYQLQGTNQTTSGSIYTLFHQGGAGTSCRGDAESECLGYAQIQAPDGATLESLNFWAHDSSTDSDLHFTVFENCEPATGPATETVIRSGDLPVSTGDYYHSDPLGGVVVNNRECAYTVRLRFTDPGEPPRDAAIRVRKMQVSWRRQVSPAPSTATFGDVPADHPFFRFIEALRSSGITGGCSAEPPLYCPEAPITRGQMAVFIATALGLSWP